ncbi:ABC transporter substrate-binding protein [Saccharothrix longispora]|uniref:NitT/TauT family transport system substrate-binding protein n=1 Tax=Saccharothrix longispora TaxID=33920 RepID=A0ABU1PN36_9PSEU|nr:ABC transporter substrate-binding protein [Saccharothrix longispora]MDR6591861.1 NitT/TauT family transport system substrate-binding protein [Saccharothrix longispora]
MAVTALAARARHAAVVLAALVLAGCGYGSLRDADPTPVAASGPKLSVDEVRIGHLPNVTHATPLVGVRDGFFAKELGGTGVADVVFNAGPSLIEALNANAVDIGWIGPSPIVNGYARAGGVNLRVISGAASGGVRLVVRPEIASAQDLRGRRIASPQLGNTQDVALLTWLAEQGLRVDARSGRGDVSVVRTDNAEMPSAYRTGAIDGAWAPEPTAAKLVAEGGKVLLEESDLWPDGEFATTNVVVSQRFLAEHRDVVAAVLRGSVAANAWINANPGPAKESVNGALRRLTGKALPAEVIDRAWESVEFTDDPLASTLETQAGHAAHVGLIEPPDLRGLYDLSLLNDVLRAAGRPAVTDSGLGAK